MNKVNVSEGLSPEKKDLLNQVIAAGLNSLNIYSGESGSEERKLLELFSNEEIESLANSFSLLNHNIQVEIFNKHRELFVDALRNSND